MTLPVSEERGFTARFSTALSKGAFHGRPAFSMRKRPRTADAPNGAKCTAGQSGKRASHAPDGAYLHHAMHQMVQNAPQVRWRFLKPMHQAVRFGARVHFPALPRFSRCTIDAPFGARRTAGQRAFLAIYAPFGAFWCMRASDLGFYDGADLHQMVRPCTKTARLSDKSFRRSGFSACRKSQFRQLRCRTALTC